MNLRTMLDNVVVPHDAFTAAESQLEQMYVYKNAGGKEPSALAVVGDTRTGKSRIAERFRDKHPPFRTPEGLEIPVLLAEVPSEPSIKGLADTLLEAIGSPDWGSNTTQSKTAALVKLFEECKVRMLYLEEFQHFADQTSDKVQVKTAEWLKVLTNRTKVGLVVSGLPRLQTVVHSDPQLKGRFGAPCIIPRFNWDVDSDRNQWRKIVLSFQTAIRQHFDVPDIGSRDLSLRLYLGSGGLIGYLK